MAAPDRWMLIGQGLHHISSPFDSKQVLSSSGMSSLEEFEF
jgi:hypothetical protein